MTESDAETWELAKQGDGIGIWHAYFGDADPCVKRVLPDLEPLTFPIWLVAHRAVTSSRRIRWVYDFLAEEFKR